MGLVRLGHVQGRAHAAFTTGRGVQVEKVQQHSPTGRDFLQFLRDMPMCIDLSDREVLSLVGVCYIETFAACQVPPHCLC